jgi:glycosyltransferase involved in cell wall biosynthesis
VRGPGPTRPALTIAIPSYQRREPLGRLLDSLADALRDAGSDAVEVLVVIDGSDDGSEELVRDKAQSYPAPLRSSWQSNAGLAAARNRCIDDALGEVVWFLDDDMIVTSTALEAHRGYDRMMASVLMGPCHVSTPEPDLVRAGAFYAARHARLATTGLVTHPRDCSFANTSAPAELLRAHRFDDRFRGYGVEDYDLGARLVAAGEQIAFDPAAGVVHDFHATRSERRRKLREEGHNKAMFAVLYPERSDVAFDPGAGRVELVLRRVAFGRLARSLSLAEGATSALAAIVPPRFGRHRLMTYAELFAVYTGVADFRADANRQRPS